MICGVCLQLLQELDSYTVVERDGSTIACAALYPYLDDKCGEVAAFAVSPECRGHGQGDSLLGTLTRSPSLAILAINAHIIT